MQPAGNRDLEKLRTYSKNLAALRDFKLIVEKCEDEFESDSDPSFALKLKNLSKIFAALKKFEEYQTVYKGPLLLEVKKIMRSTLHLLVTTYGKDIDVSVYYNPNSGAHVGVSLFSDTGRPITDPFSIYEINGLIVINSSEMPSNLHTLEKKFSNHIIVCPFYNSQRTVFIVGYSSGSYYELWNGSSIKQWDVYADYIIRTDADLLK